MKRMMNEYDQLKLEISAVNLNLLKKLRKQNLILINKLKKLIKFIIMSKIGHNRPPVSYNPKDTIKKNINRRKLIVDDGITLHKKVPLPTWIELSLIDVCIKLCFCPKSDDKIAPDTYQKMSKKLIDKLHDDLKDEL